MKLPNNIDGSLSWRSSFLMRKASLSILFTILSMEDKCFLSWFTVERNLSMHVFPTSIKVDMRCEDQLIEVRPGLKAESIVAMWFFKISSSRSVRESRALL
jgi:hypothetical protein